MPINPLEPMSMQHAPHGKEERRTGNAIPNDPENMNDDRSNWAAKAIAAFMKETGCDVDEALGDLLCDPMHWSDRNGQSFPNMLARAQDHYLEETMSDFEIQKRIE